MNFDPNHTIGIPAGVKYYVEGTEYTSPGHIWVTPIANPAGIENEMCWFVTEAGNVGFYDTSTEPQNY